MTFGCTPFYRFLSLCLTVYYYVICSFSVLLYLIKNPFKPLTKDRPTPPDYLMNPEHGEHKYITVNGIKLHYVEKGDPSKPLMVFIHGFPEFWFSWRHQLAEFSKDYWCIALDMRGCGDSEKPKDLKEYRVHKMIDDIKELVCSLGRERFILIGHDWGSIISNSFMDTYGSMVDKYVVMSGPVADVWARMVFSDKWQFLHSWYIFFFQGPCVPEMLYKMGDFKSLDAMMDPKDVEAYKYIFSKPGTITAGINYYRANFLRNFPPIREVDNARGLYIIGEKDPYISKDTARRMKETYGQIESMILKNGRHFIHHEQPNEVNKIIREFLQK